MVGGQLGGILRQNPKKQTRDFDIFPAGDWSGQCLSLSRSVWRKVYPLGGKSVLKNPIKKKPKPSAPLLVVFIRFLSRSEAEGGERERRGEKNKRKKARSDFVVDIGGALRRHLLDYVNRVAVIAAHFLVVRAVVVLCPQGDDDVAGFGAGRAPGEFGVGQGAEGEGGGARLRVRVLASPLAHLDEQDDQQEDEHEKDDAAGGDGGEHGHARAQEAVRVGGSVGLVLVHVVMVSWQHWAYPVVVRWTGAGLRDGVVLRVRFGAVRRRWVRRVWDLPDFHDDFHGFALAHAPLAVLQALHGAIGGRGNEVVDVPLELQAHVVGAKLLKLDGELDVFLRLVAGDQDVGIQDCTASLGLYLLDQIQLVVFIVPARVRLGANDVQLIPNVRVDHQARSV